MPSDHQSRFSLYSTSGERKYLNRSERLRVIAALERLPSDRALFVLTLCWSGARVSEVLALRADSFQLDTGLVAIKTLKRRRHSVREVPLPPEVMARLDTRFELRRRQLFDDDARRRLWNFERTTAWRIVKRVMGLAQLHIRAASPRGLRHAFGVGTVQSGIPINLVQRWLGHARLTTTAIYTEAVGEEERDWARRYWGASSPQRSKRTS